MDVFITQPHHHHLRQSVVAASHNQMLTVGVDTQQRPSRFVSHEFGPVVPTGSGNGGGGQHEILGIVAVVPDEKPVAVVNHVVLEIRVARFDQRRNRVGIVGIQEAPLRHIVAAGYDVNESPAIGFAGADEKTWVLFVIDQFIVGRVIPQGVPVDAHRAVVLVQHRVIERVRRRRIAPLQTVVGIRDGVGQGLAGFQVQNQDGELFGAVEIHAVGDQSVVRAVFKRPYAGVVVALCK